MSAIHNLKDRLKKELIELQGQMQDLAPHAPELERLFLIAEINELQGVLKALENRIWEEHRLQEFRRHQMKDRLKFRIEGDGLEVLGRR